jgi:hypothetical protein
MVRLIAKLSRIIRGQITLFVPALPEQSRDIASRIYLAFGLGSILLQLLSNCFIDTSRSNNLGDALELPLGRGGIEDWLIKKAHT